MTATDFGSSGLPVAAASDSTSAGAEIFRRFERRSHEPRWISLVMLVVLAVAAVGGAVTYETLLASATPPPAASADTGTTAS